MYSITCYAINLFNVDSTGWGYNGRNVDILADNAGTSLRTVTEVLAVTHVTDPAMQARIRLADVGGQVTPRSWRKQITNRSKYRAWVTVAKYLITSSVMM